MADETDAQRAKFTKAAREWTKKAVDACTAEDRGGADRLAPKPFSLAAADFLSDLGRIHAQGALISARDYTDEKIAKLEEATQKLLDAETRLTALLEKRLK